MITKLQSKRTGEVADILEVNKGVYTIRKSDGTEKNLSASTVKRWWKEIQVEGEPAPKPIKPACETERKKGRIVKKGEAAGPEHPAVAKKRKADELRKPLLDSILHYAYKEDLTAEKKKVYIGLYYGDRRVAEMRPVREGIRLAVHPKVVENFSEEDYKKVVVQPKSYRVYFNVLFFIKNADDLEYALRLIQLSKAKVLKTYRG